MKILYDYQVFEMQTHGGVSRCFASIINYLPEYFQYKVAINQSSNVYLKENGLQTSSEIYQSKFDSFFLGLKFKGRGKLFRFWYKIFYPNEANPNESNLNFSIRLLKSNDYDVFHPTFFEDYFLEYIGDKPFVLTIHDMIPELFPKYFNTDDFQIVNKQKLVKRAAHIVAVSENTKKDIIEILGVNPSKISVVYHGTPPIKKMDFKSFPFPYILYVGDREGYKNFIPFIKECKRVIGDNSKIKIVCTGKPFNDNENGLFSELKIMDNIIHTFVTSDELYSLYKNALLFVYPSSYEGFGISILEAFACGCPVFLNNTSCFPEIAGDAALYFDMNEEKSNFYEVYNSYMSEIKINRDVLIEKGYKRMELFSWKKAAEQYSDIYKTII